MIILIVSPKNKTVFNFRGDLILDMISAGHEVIVTGPNKDFIDDIMALGVKKFIEVPVVKDNTSVIGDLRYFRLLCKVMNEERPDLVFSYTIKPVVYGSIAAGLCGIKRIVAMVTGLGRVYTSDSLKTKAVRQVTKTLYKQAFRYCDTVIFQNRDDIRELVSAHYLPEQKTALVNGSGVNMKRFCRSELPETPVFLMVGRVIREKGVMEFCNAARRLKKVAPEARCVLLGGFDQSIGALQPKDIQPFIDDSSIEFPGEVKDPVSFYSDSSVFVLPSYYREGLPRTILEAMSCGRPVITTDWPGCREPMVDGENGFLVPIRDAEKLAEKMVIMAKDRASIERMGEKAWQYCKTNYSVETVNSQMRKVLDY